MLATNRGIEQMHRLHVPVTCLLSSLSHCIVCIVGLSRQYIHLLGIALPMNQPEQSLNLMHLMQYGRRSRIILIAQTLQACMQSVARSRRRSMMLSPSLLFPVAQSIAHCQDMSAFLLVSITALQASLRTSQTMCSATATAFPSRKTPLYMERFAGGHPTFSFGCEVIETSCYGSAWSFGWVRNIRMMIFLLTLSASLPLALA